MVSCRSSVPALPAAAPAVVKGDVSLRMVLFRESFPDACIGYHSVWLAFALPRGGKMGFKSEQNVEASEP